LIITFTSTCVSNKEEVNNILIDNNIIDKREYIIEKYDNKNNLLNQCTDCKSLFSLLVISRSETCISVFNNFINVFDAINLQMQWYNTIITIFIAPVDNDETNKLCIKHELIQKYKFIKFIHFNHTELLMEFDFTEEALIAINSWPYLRRVDSLRKSDILRLCLASKYRSTYIELDILLLSENINPYLMYFSSVILWKNDGFGIEFSNTAFCLHPYLINKILKYQLTRILKHTTVSFEEKIVDLPFNLTAEEEEGYLNYKIVKEITVKSHGEKNWKFDELGPVSFHLNLINSKIPIRLLSQNIPNEFNISKIKQGINDYGHLFLHVNIGGEKKLFENIKHTGGNFACYIYNIKREIGIHGVYSKDPIPNNENYEFIDSKGKSNNSDINNKCLNMIENQSIKNNDPKINPNQLKIKPLPLCPVTSVHMDSYDQSTVKNVEKGHKKIFKKNNHQQLFSCSNIFTTLDGALKPGTGLGSNNHSIDSCCSQLNKIQTHYTHEIIENMINQIIRLDTELTIFIDKKSNCLACLRNLIKTIILKMRKYVETTSSATDTTVSILSYLFQYFSQPSKNENSKLLLSEEEKKEKKIKSKFDIIEYDREIVYQDCIPTSPINIKSKKDKSPNFLQESGSISLTKSSYVWSEDSPNPYSSIGTENSINKEKNPLHISYYKTKYIENLPLFQRSEFIKVCLAKKYKMTYVHISNLLIADSNAPYLKEFISLPSKKTHSWNAHAGISASAFCLSPYILTKVIDRHWRSIIELYNKNNVNYNSNNNNNNNNRKRRLQVTSKTISGVNDKLLLTKRRKKRVENIADNQQTRKDHQIIFEKNRNKNKLEKTDPPHRNSIKLNNNNNKRPINILKHNNIKNNKILTLQPQKNNYEPPIFISSSILPSIFNLNTESIQVNSNPIPTTPGIYFYSTNNPMNIKLIDIIEDTKHFHHIIITITKPMLKQQINNNKYSSSLSFIEFVNNFYSLMNKDDRIVEYVSSNNINENEIGIMYEEFSKSKH
jgi:hypothetical protein